MLQPAAENSALGVFKTIDAHLVAQCGPRLQVDGIKDSAAGGEKLSVKRLLKAASGPAAD